MTASAIKLSRLRQQRRIVHRAWLTDCELVEQYVHKVRLLAMKAAQGEEVQSAVRLTIDEACDHFVVRATAEQANRAALKAKLRLAATAADASQSMVRQIFEYAASLVDD